MLTHSQSTMSANSFIRRSVARAGAFAAQFKSEHCFLVRAGKASIKAWRKKIGRPPFTSAQDWTFGQ
jgi:hypothetical protein